MLKPVPLQSGQVMTSEAPRVCTLGGRKSKCGLLPVPLRPNGATKMFAQLALERRERRRSPRVRPPSPGATASEPVPRPEAATGVASSSAESGGPSGSSETTSSNSSFGWTRSCAAHCRRRTVQHCLRCSLLGEKQRTPFEPGSPETNMTVTANEAVPNASTKQCALLGTRCCKTQRYRCSELMNRRKGPSRIGVRRRRSRSRMQARSPHSWGALHSNDVHQCPDCKWTPAASGVHTSQKQTCLPYFIPFYTKRTI